MPTRRLVPRRPNFAIPVNLAPEYACGGSFTATEPLMVYTPAVEPTKKAPAKPKRHARR